jgi:magnesium chelatase subunit I
MENVVSNAERRMLRNGESTVVPRVSDIYSAMPAITGKLELEYEGELRGADTVVHDLIRLAVARTFDTYFKDSSMQQITQWFDLGGQLKFSDTAPTSELMDGLNHIQGLTDKLSAVGVKTKDKPEMVVSAAEFLLEGLYAHKRIGRSEERVFTAPEKQLRVEKTPGREEFPTRPRRPYN